MKPSGMRHCATLCNNLIQITRRITFKFRIHILNLNCNLVMQSWLLSDHWNGTFKPASLCSAVLSQN